jgi:hypothetical protein
LLKKEWATVTCVFSCVLAEPHWQAEECEVV